MNIQFDLDTAGSDRLLNAARKFAKSPRKAITGALFALDRKIRDTFQQQKDPWGKPWKPLKPATLAGRKRKGRNRTSILVDTAEMFRSLEREVTGANEGVISIGTEDRPVTPHQFGVKENNLPARPMMPIRPSGVSIPKTWRDAVDDELVKAMRESIT